MAVSPSFRTYILEQLGRSVRDIRGRSMFGGVGIYSGGFFFALIDDDTLYFKVDESNRRDFEVRGMARSNRTAKTARRCNTIACRKICSRTPRCLVIGLRRRSL